MREIKFRAWNKKTKEMFDVHEIKVDRLSRNLTWVRGYGESDYEGTEVYGGGNMLYANKPRYELMQFTGLKDKNGVEIYEGDICKSKVGYVGKIVFSETSAEFSLGVKRELNKYILENHTLLYAYRELEVIGNVHDNPELLEAKK